MRDLKEVVVRYATWGPLAILATLLMLVMLPLYLWSRRNDKDTSRLYDYY